MSRALRGARDPAAEMMILATEVADGMAATAALAASRLSDRTAALADSFGRLAVGVFHYARARPLLVVGVAAAAVLILRRAGR